MQVKLNRFVRFLILFPALVLLINSTSVLWGQVTATEPIISAGREFMVPKVEMNGKMIGQEDVLITEVHIKDNSPRYRRLEGRDFQRLDLGVSGNLDV